MFNSEIEEVFMKVYSKLSGASNDINDIINDMSLLKQYIDNRTELLIEQQGIINALEGRVAVLTSDVESAELIIDDF